MGWAVQEEGRLAEARGHFETAIRLQPEHGAAYMNLGGLQEELGDLAEAEEAFRTALRVQPSYALPHARLATLLRGQLPDQDLAAVEERLNDDNLAVDRAVGCCSPWPTRWMVEAITHCAAECLRAANALTIEVNEKRRRLQPGRT